jgi:feruloyl esterase
LARNRKAKRKFWLKTLLKAIVMEIKSFFVCLVLLWSAAAPAILEAQQSCESLTAVRLDHAQVLSAANIPAAPLKTPPASPFPLPAVTVPAHCEVKAVARPSADSEIQFEIWLPPASAWNGKFVQHGNGGWAGGIPTWALVTPLIRGYAAAATDDGHTAKSPMPDASWAIGHPEKLIDFGYRAVHETFVQSMAILYAYYGKSQTRSYFVGCSDGGREALMEAERFPQDFDGIIAGAPANNWVRLFTGFVWNELALHATPQSAVPASKLPLIQKAALAKCDALDGVKDGLIEDPRLCHFDPATLLCSGADAQNCLTAAQVETVKKIQTGPVLPGSGEQIFPGYEPGTAAYPGDWGLWILGPAQPAFGNTFFGQAVHEDPNWDWHSFNLESDLKLAQEKASPVLDSTNPDLRSFRDRGGKLIQYHGWGDAAIAPRDSIAFYEKVQKFLRQYPDARADASKPVEDFYRLFMVPGMGHCALGPGPVHFGNDDVVDASLYPQDADHDVFLSLDRWATQGVAPEQIIGTGRMDTNPEDPSKGTPMTRPLCSYPKVAHYKGHGETHDSANFICLEK